MGVTSVAWGGFGASEGAYGMGLIAAGTDMGYLYLVDPQALIEQQDSFCVS